VGKLLDGLSAVVNGGGRGIGQAVALEFARQGASVVVNDLGANADGSRDPSRAQRVVDQVRAEGGEATANSGDIADPSDAEAMIGTAIEEYGKLDILVNAAGNVYLGTIVDTTPEEFDSIMRVHVRGYFNTSRLAAQHWVERAEYGRLINFVSMAAQVSFPSLFAYSTAKSAIVGMTRSTANALVSYNVTANCIRPSASTGMSDFLSPVEDPSRPSRRIYSENAPGTAADPAHIAPMVAYLASPAAAHVSGRFLEARGGHYALWTEPVRERTFDGEFLEDPDGVYDGIHEMLAGLSLRDLKMPMPPFAELGDWKKKYGTMVPAWDFAGLK
jgi:NAD(P)-dependent dehydrogenase (short-subunit alcohol dehydrogenase family)